ncbi:MAG: ABC transporter substrate-binding protein [Vicinamibacterales bacterium]
MRWSTRRGVLAAATAASLLAAACGGDDGDSADGGGAPTGDTILIGTSLPLTGQLGSFGPLLEAGYEAAIDDVNAAGGLKVGDKTYQVELKVVDNKSDGNQAASQARELVLSDQVVAMLGAVTPPLSIPLSVAAEQNKVPMVSTATPIQAWLGGNKDGWHYAFDAFFDENHMTDLQFNAADLVDTNKKVALFTDLEEDGKVMGGMWVDKAPEFGYEIVSHAEFAVGTTNFSAQIEEAKKAQAEVVISQVVPPDAISLLKQMKAAGYQPKVMFIEKGSSFGAWPQASEGLGDGIMVAAYFAEGLDLPNEAEMLAKFSKDGSVNPDVGGSVLAYSAARVLMDGISQAGSTDSDAIVAALEKLEGDYPFGHVDFGDDHAAATPTFMGQWVGADIVAVTTAEGKAGPAEPQAPVTGLK